MYCTWTVSKLKQELKSRGASVKGRKVDLITRLESYDRNFNFGIPQEEEIEEKKIDLPPPESYRDINSSTKLPKLTKQHIQLYFEEHDKKPDDGLRLYEARYLTIIRAASVGQQTFIKGICKASMKKILYEVNIKIQEDGYIVETSCECVAGGGTEAHCKHVALVLYAVEHMVREKIIIKHQIPTEKLQTFHVPKSVFTSSPIKTSKLSKIKMGNIIFSPCMMKVDGEEYNKRFKSLITNYTGSNMPLKQLYKPANPYGVEWDHCYCKTSAQEVLLSSLDLNSISLDKASAIEKETRGQAYNAEWLKRREVRITASKFHTICHLKEENLHKFAEQDMNRREFKSKATNHGILNEKVALQQYMEETELQITQCGLFISCERPYLVASPDGLLGEETVIEIKCPYASRRQKISPLTVPYLVKGQRDGDLTLKNGSPCFYQVQGQLYCTGRKYCNLVVYTFVDMKIIFLERDDDFIHEMITKLDFYYDCFFKKALFNKYIYKNYLEIIKKT